VKAIFSTKSLPERRAGFTLVEIMVVLAVVGLLAAIAVPMFSKARASALNGRFIADLKAATGAFEIYAMENKNFPPDVIQAVVPPAMVSYMPARIRWTEPTPIGGSWDWDYNQFGGMTGVSVFRPSRTEDEMRAIDAMIDDGDLATGVFRKRPDGFIYLLDR
jgi:type IV pilus assembly protein PilA